jgi:hypothetical protein
MIMEAEKSHDRPSASWRPHKADCVAQSKSKGLRTMEAKGVNSVMAYSLRTWKPLG